MKAGDGMTGVTALCDDYQQIPGKVEKRVKKATFQGFFHLIEKQPSHLSLLVTFFMFYEIDLLVTTI